VAIGVGIVVAAGIVGGLAAAGVFKGSSPGQNNPAGMKNGTVSVTIGE
jgi:hypothetical protein